MMYPNGGVSPVQGMDAKNEIHSHEWMPLVSQRKSNGQGRQFIQYRDMCLVCDKIREGRTMLDTDRMRHGL